MMFNQEEKSDLLIRLKWYGSFRLIMAFSLCLLTWIVKPGADGYLLEQSFFAVAGLTFLHLFVAVLFFISFNVASRRHVFLFSFVQIAWEVVFSTSLVHLTGGIESQFKFLYWLTITNAAFLLFRHGAFFAASMSAIFYGALANLLYLRKVPMIFDRIWYPERWQEGQVISSIVSNAVSFFVVAWVSSHLATRYRQSQAELAEKNIQVKDMTQKIREAEQLAAVGELAARIAHEIRNPLTSISGAMQMLMYQTNLDQESQKLMNIAVRESDRLNLLLTEFLHFAKPVVPEFKKIQLDQLLHETIESFSHSPGYQGIRFEYEFNEPAYMMGDAEQLTQVFWNLLTNAAEAMNGTGVIQVNIDLKNPEKIIVSLHDSGKGVPAGIKSKIFQPFFTTKNKGTGLGLSIVHRILEQHQADIDLESLENQGSTFRIKLSKIIPHKNFEIGSMS